MKKEYNEELIKLVLNKINNNPREKPISFYIRKCNTEKARLWRIIAYLEEKKLIESYPLKVKRCKHNRSKLLAKTVNVTEEGRKFLKGGIN
jgi:hypothetical protein